MAGMTLGSCGKCHRPIQMPSPVGSFKGADGRSHMTHKACADPVNAEVNPVVVTDRKELLKDVMKIDLPPLPPIIESSTPSSTLPPTPPVSDSEPAEDIKDIPTPPITDSPAPEDVKDLPTPPVIEPKPSTPVREQQAARRKPPAKRAPKTPVKEAE